MNRFNLFKAIVNFIQKNKNSKGLRGSFITLASVIVFTTTYALILPALTLEIHDAKQMAGLDLGEDELLNENEITEDQDLDLYDVYDSYASFDEGSYVASDYCYSADEKYSALACDKFICKEVCCNGIRWSA